MTKTPTEQFIEFMQQNLGRDVNTPMHGTDVLRATRFPGLDSQDQAPEFPFNLPSVSGDPFGQAGLSVSENPQVAPNPSGTLG